MPSIRPTLILRLALLGDALASGATGLLAFAGAGLLGDLLGLPIPLLRYAGLLLLPYAALVAWVGTRDRLVEGVVWVIVAGNAVWAFGSVLLLVSGRVAPTALGVAFVAFQAAVVAMFGAAQAYGLRARPSVAAHA
jgi:hypothetical protein